MTRVARIGGIVVLAGVAAMVLAASAPRFPSHSTLDAEVNGRLVTLRWPAARAIGGARIAAYGIEVNGREVTRAPGSATACALSGLAGGAKYRLAVVAYDTRGRPSRHEKKWSPGRARLSITTDVPAIGAPGSLGFVCAPVADRDGDRLPDAYETGTRTLVDVHATGTDPNDHDTDDDGLSDGDEVLGTTAHLDLYHVGTRPAKKDLLVEFDWFDDSIACGPHTHRLPATVVDRMTTDLAAVNVANADGSTGINLIADLGQGGGLTGGNLVPDADGIIVGGVGGFDYFDIKVANFRPERQGYFHYALLPHRHNPDSPETGQAWVGGVDLVASIWFCNPATVPVSSTILHELGHNLGLNHGGADVFPEINFKPNYNSIMNYRYALTGTDTDCDGDGDGGPAIFSDGSLPSIDENALLEPVGICNGVPIDWNGDGQIQTEPVKVDLTPESFGLPPDGRFDVLEDYDDLANLCLPCIELFQPGAPIGGQRLQAPTPIVADGP